MKKLLGLVVAVALISGVAMADNGSPYPTTVPVNITVASITELYMDNSPVELILNSANQENSDEVARSITHLNNIAIDISVKVDGTLPSMLDGGGVTRAAVNFFIFPQGTIADARAAMVANSNAPAGALWYNYLTVGRASEVVFDNQPAGASSVTLPIVYAADAPNVAPVATGVTPISLTVTWTIAAN